MLHKSILTAQCRSVKCILFHLETHFVGFPALQSNRFEPIGFQVPVINTLILMANHVPYTTHLNMITFGFSFCLISACYHHWSALIHSTTPTTLILFYLFFHISWWCTKRMYEFWPLHVRMLNNCSSRGQGNDRILFGQVQDRQPSPSVAPSHGKCIINRWLLLVSWWYSSKDNNAGSPEYRALVCFRSQMVFGTGTGYLILWKCRWAWHWIFRKTTTTDSALFVGESIKLESNSGNLWALLVVFVGLRFSPFQGHTWIWWNFS